jgi:hypothetical protein
VRKAKETEVWKGWERNRRGRMESYRSTKGIKEKKKARD